MTIQELINKMLEHDVSPSSTVLLETKHGRLDLWNVNVGKHRGYTVLTIEPTEEVYSEDEAREDFQ